MLSVTRITAKLADSEPPKTNRGARKAAEEALASLDIERSPLVAPAAKGWTSKWGDKPRKGCDILVECLEREGVDTVFAYPVRHPSPSPIQLQHIEMLSKFPHSPPNFLNPQRFPFPTRSPLRSPQGGASMEIHQALTRTTQIRNILCRHEQGEVFAAEGYAKVTGKVGVCIATSGPGATNLVTGLADALLDSVPMVAITGQVRTRI